MSDRNTSRPRPRPDCLRCQHYFVTWEPETPRGCHAYEFKSPEMPSEVVRASSGEPCQLFVPKKQSGGRRRLLR